MYKKKTNKTKQQISNAIEFLAFSNQPMSAWQGYLENEIAFAELLFVRCVVTTVATLSSFRAFFLEVLQDLKTEREKQP